MSKPADKNVKEQVKDLWNASHDKTYNQYINSTNHFSKFHGFPNELLRSFSWAEMKILLYLINPVRMRESDTACWKRFHNNYITRKDIMKGLEFDRSQVSRGLRALEAKDCIYLVKEDGQERIYLNERYASIGRSDKTLNWIGKMTRIHAPQITSHSL